MKSKKEKIPETIGRGLVVMFFVFFLWLMYFAHPLIIPILIGLTFCAFAVGTVLNFFIED